MRKIRAGQPPGRSYLRGAGARHRLIDRLQSSLLNPLDRLAFALRLPPPGDALLETIGRRTGRRRVTPVCDGLDGDTFWVVAQHGRSADYVLGVSTGPSGEDRDRLAGRHGAHPRRRRSRGADADPRQRQPVAPALPASQRSRDDEPADRANRPGSTLIRHRGRRGDLAAGSADVDRCRVRQLVGVMTVRDDIGASHGTEEPARPGRQRRTANRAAGGADRRRLRRGLLFTAPER